MHTGIILACVHAHVDAMYALDCVRTSALVVYERGSLPPPTCLKQDACFSRVCVPACMSVRECLLVCACVRHLENGLLIGVAVALVHSPRTIDEVDVAKECHILPHLHKPRYSSADGWRKHRQMLRES